MLDLYLLITQGQFSPNTEFKTIAGGYYVYVEEEIIEFPVRRGGSSTTGLPNEDIIYKKKKRIYLRVRLEEGKVFEKDIILDNINLVVSNVKQLDKDIIVEVKDPFLSDSITSIKVTPIFD